MIRNFSIIFILMMWFLLTGQSQQKGFEYHSGRSYITVPIKVIYNLVIIPISINDSPPIDFILDTGIKTTILTEPLVAQYLDIDLSQKTYLFGLGGEGFLEATRASGITIKISEVIGKDMDLIVLPQGLLSFSEIFGFPVYGIIGYDLFRNFPIQIDYVNQTARIYNKPTYRIPSRTHVIPFEIVDDKPYTQTQLIGAMGDTLSINLLIDLGASHPIYLNSEHLEIVPQTLRGFLGKGISGSLIGEVGRLDKALIGDITIDEPIIVFPDKGFLNIAGRQLQWQGIIGGAILSRFIVLIDYPSRQMLLRPNNEFGNPFYYNLSGLEVTAEGPDFNRFKIIDVRPGSPAYEAGIMPGDIIISINRQEYEILSLESIQDILSGEVSEIIYLLLQRQDEFITKQFRLRSDI